VFAHIVPKSREARDDNLPAPLILAQMRAQQQEFQVQMDCLLEMQTRQRTSLRLWTESRALQHQEQEELDQLIASRRRTLRWQEERSQLMADEQAEMQVQSDDLVATCRSLSTEMQEQVEMHMSVPQQMRREYDELQSKYALARHELAVEHEQQVVLRQVQARMAAYEQQQQLRAAEQDADLRSRLEAALRYHHDRRAELLSEQEDHRCIASEFANVHAEVAATRESSSQCERNALLRQASMQRPGAPPKAKPRARRACTASHCAFHVEALPKALQSSYQCEVIAQLRRPRLLGLRLWPKVLSHSTCQASIFSIIGDTLS